jgi:hypothetical protein
MTIPVLNPEELDCLTALAGEEACRVDLCDPATLRRLSERGLIEPIPVVWLPVPVVRSGYRLTAKGVLAWREQFSKY